MNHQFRLLDSARLIACCLITVAPLHAQAEDPPQEEAQFVDPRLEAPTLPLSLDSALTLAETNNLGLLLEDVAMDVARFNARGAWGNFDWIFGARASYADSEQNPVNSNQGSVRFESTREFYEVSLTRPLETGGEFSTRYSSLNSDSGSSNSIGAITDDAFSFSYTQPLLRGAGVDRGTSFARESDLVYLQQVERRREVMQQLLRQTSDAYWDLVQSLQQFGVAESSLELGREQLQRNQRLLDAGVGTEVEVIQAEAEVARREETRLAADVTRRVAGDSLKALLFPGKQPVSWSTVLEPTTPLPDDVSVDRLEDWTEILERALRLRPELRQQQLRIQIAELRHERAISDRRLGVDWDSSLSSAGRDEGFVDAKENVLDFSTVSWDVGLTLNAPIGNRTRRYAENAARAEVRAARITMEQLETQVVSEVREAVRQLHYQSLAVRAAGVSRKAAERQLEAEEARYENDLTTNFQVLEFQLRLVEAMNNEQTARSNFAKAGQQLQAAQGTLGERP